MALAFRRLPAPGRSVWWLSGAMLSGLAFPALIAAVLTVAGYYPVGSALPKSWIWGTLGAVLVPLGMTSAILVASPFYSLLARSWRPLILVLFFGLFVCFGLLPGLLCGTGLQRWAFDLFVRRSSNVVSAIEVYSRATGAPPKSLAELVPHHLPALPMTGMAAHPDYQYSADAGPCSGMSEWHLSVSMPAFLDTNRLLYCPQQDYESLVYPAISRVMIGAWAYERIAW